MPRGVKKENLPTKICVTCQRPFTWRKKWDRVWDEVTTCSKSCNRKRSQLKNQRSKDDTPLNVQEPGQLNDDDDDLSCSLESSKPARQKQEQELDFDEIKPSLKDEDPRACRKAAKKELKAARRAQREDPTAGQKPCDHCSNQVNLLIRCQVDSTAIWRMVCGKCWHTVSGGVVDGDADHPYYRYGGLWKNKRRQK
jgi:hypothetical protein